MAWPPVLKHEHGHNVFLPQDWIAYLLPEHTVSSPKALTGADLMLPGRTGFLEAIIHPINATNRQVTWQSNNPAIAFVDSVRGNVIALARGEATLTVTTSDGGHTAEARVTVHEASPEIVSVTNVRVEPAQLDLMAGSTGKIKATVYPLNATYQAVEYISGNPDIATVDQDGTVTAHHPGTARLTAISRENPSISAVSEVKNPLIKRPVLIFVKKGGGNPARLIR